MFPLARVMGTPAEADGADYHLQWTEDCSALAECETLDEAGEPDALETARTLSIDTPLEGWICGDPDDYFDEQDFFRITAEPGCLNEVSVSFDPDLADLSLYLYETENADSETAGSTSEAGAAHLRFALSGDTPTDRWIGLHAYDTTSAPYTITHRCLTIASCEDDVLEPNDVLGEATRLAEAVPTIGAVCDADADWFRAFVGAEENITFTLDPAPGPDALGFALHDANGEVLVEATSGSAQLTYDNWGSGRTLYAEVTSTGTSSVPYTISYVKAPAVPTECVGQDEDDEPESPDSPRVLELNLPFEGFVCTRDTDHFTVAPAADCLPTLTLTYDPAETDLVLDPGGKRTPGQEVRVGTYATVDSPSNESGHYTLVYTCPPLAVCDPDPNEPNDNDDNDGTTSGERTPLAPDQSLQGEVCNEDLDYFDLWVDPGCTAVITLDFDHAANDLDLWLLTRTGSLLASSQSLTDGEQIAWTNHTDTPVARVPLVKGWGPGPGPYTIHFAQDCGGTCDDDPFEPDTIDDAGYVGLNSPVVGQMCGPDSDFWWFEAAPGCENALSLTYTTADDLDLYLYPETTDWPLTPAVSASGNAGDATLGVPDSDSLVSWWVEVRGDAGVEGDYTLTHTCAPATSCTDDAHEPNDTLGEAVPLPQRMNLSGQVCGSDEDWFAIEVPVAERGVVTLYFDHAANDLSLALHDENGLLIDSSNTSTNTEQVSFDNGPDSVRHLFVEVSGIALEPGDYTLSFAAAPYQPMACVGLDEPGEPGAEEEPRALILDVPFEGFLCTTDQDTFEVTLATHCLNTVVLTYDANETTLAFGTPLDTKRTAGRVSQTWVTEDATSQQITIDSPTDESGSYTLLYTCPPLVSCNPDANEPNDDAQSATALADGASLQGEVCYGDEDHFLVQVDPGCVGEVTLDFVHAENDLDLVLFDHDDGIWVDRSETLDDGESVSYTLGAGNLAPALLRARVLGNGVGPGAYTIHFAQACAPACEDDAFEPDAIDAPRPLVLDTPLDGLMCGPDADFFQFEAQPGCENALTLNYFAYDDLDLSVYADPTDWPSAPSLTAMGSAGAATLSLPDAGAAPVTWWVEAYGPETAEGSYTLTHTCTSPGNCGDDVHEPNDSLRESATLRPMEPLTGSVCADDEDWFALQAEAMTQAFVQLMFTHAENDLALWLYDADGFLSAFSDGTSDFEEVSHLNFDETPMTVFIRVTGADASPGEYMLSANLLYF